VREDRAPLSKIIYFEQIAEVPDRRVFAGSALLPSQWLRKFPYVPLTSSFINFAVGQL